MVKSDQMIEAALKEIDGIEFVKTINKYIAYNVIHQNMFTTYKILGGNIYHFDGRTMIILDNDNDDTAYEVILDERINEFVTDGDSELFDILSFITL